MKEKNEKPEKSVKLEDTEIFTFHDVEIRGNDLYLFLGTSHQNDIVFSKDGLVDLEKDPNFQPIIKNNLDKELLDKLFSNTDKSEDVLKILVEKSKEHLYFEQEETHLLLAVYIVVTHCFKLFDKIPYLWITGDYGSGKSTVINFMNEFCRRAHKVDNISAAALYRMLNEFKPTMIIDEAESLSRRSGSNSPMLDILNSGYQKEGVVARVIGGAVRHFSTFCPKIISGVNSLTPSIIDRSIKISMKVNQNLNLKKFLSDSDETSEMNNKIILALKPKLNSILESYRHPNTIVPNNLFKNRDADRWLPLLAVANSFDSNGSTKYLETLIKMGKAEVEQKNEAAKTKKEFMVKDILKDYLNANKITLKKSGSFYEVPVKEFFGVLTEADTHNRYSWVGELTKLLKETFKIVTVRRRVKKEFVTFYSVPKSFI